MQDYPINKSDEQKYIEILSQIDLFSNLPQKTIKRLLEKMNLIKVLSGELLIREGDLDSNAYILIYGRLRVTKKSLDDEDDHNLADIAPGQIVGEISLITEKARTASVTAIRDSVLLVLPQKNYIDFVAKNMEFGYEVAKRSALRLIQQTKPTQPGENVRSLAIAPAGDSDHKEFAHKLKDYLSKKYKCRLVDIDTCNRSMKSDLENVDDLSECSSKLVNWFQSLEDENDFVLFITDRQMTPWTEMCIRESDHVVFVGDATIHPALNSIELQYFSGKFNRFKTVDLILIHPEGTKKIKGTSRWLEHRKVFEFQHIHLGSRAHMEKLTRILTGNAIGVVLNGGGAKGYAHIGVLKALLDNGVPIDYIGGASMGAIIASGIAHRNFDELVAYAKDFSINFRGQYTFPYISLYSGEGVMKFFKEWYDDVLIEDLWTTFFCVSCNVSKGKIAVHNQGLLWKAIRMSTSIPAFFPPVYEGGDMHVDGGILDNMPVNVLRSLMKGGKVIAVNCCVDNVTPQSKTFDAPTMSGWKLLKDSFIQRNKDALCYDNIFSVIISSMNLASIANQELMAAEADYLIEVDTNQFARLEFQKFDEIVEVGYEACLKSISEIDINHLLAP